MSVDTKRTGGRQSWRATDARATAAQVRGELQAISDVAAERGADGLRRGGNTSTSGRALHPDFAQFVERTARSGESAPLSLRDWRNLAETWRIAQALRSCAGNRSAAARELGIGRRTLYAKMEKLGIEPRW